MMNCDVEVLLAAGDQMKFPQKMEILMDRNVWVEDTGASCDSTSHITGLNNCRVAPSDDGITLPDGSKKAATMIADLTSM
eukprot:3305057-Ditylum_brightwellii.AAC.1